MNNKFLVKVDENNLFYKIRRFIKNLFYKGNNTKSPNDTIENKKEDAKNSFVESIKNSENKNNMQTDYKYEIIAKYKYDNRDYLIVYEREKNNLNFACLDKSGNLSKLDDYESKIAIEILKNLIINKEDSQYLMKDVINGNKYNIYLSQKNNLFFWKSISGIDSKEDNYILNYKYNHQLTVIATVKNPQKNEKGNYFTRLIRIKNKLIPILLVATMNLSFLSGCTVQGRDMQESIETIQSDTYQESVETIQTDNSQETMTDSDLSFEEKSEYSWEKVQKIIDENNNLSSEEKEFLYKFKFLFEEEHQYMEMYWIYKELEKLKFEYDENACPQGETIGGTYDSSENKIVFYRAKSWMDVNYTTAIHEFLHVIQAKWYIPYFGEIMCEGKSREIMNRFIHDGILDENDLVVKGINKNSIEEYFSPDMDDPDFESMYNTKLIFQDQSLGYYHDMWIYYVFQNLATKEDFCKAFYNTQDVDGLKEYADSYEELNELFYKDIEQLRDGSYSDRHEVYKKLNKYYNKKFGINIVEDLELYAKAFPNTRLNEYNFLPYFDEYLDADIAYAQKGAVMDTIIGQILKTDSEVIFYNGQEFKFQEDDKGNIVAIALKKYEKDGDFEQCQITEELVNKYRERLAKRMERSKAIAKYDNLSKEDKESEDERE